MCHVLSHAQMSSMVLGQSFLVLWGFSFACVLMNESANTQCLAGTISRLHVDIFGPPLIPWRNVLSFLSSSKKKKKNRLMMHCTFSNTIKCE